MNYRGDGSRADAAYLASLWSCHCGWTNTRTDASCQRCGDFHPSFSKRLDSPRFPTPPFARVLTESETEVKSEDLETIAERHAGIVTPFLFDLGAQTSVSRGQLEALAAAAGLDPAAVSYIHADAEGITASVLDNGQVVLQFWPVL